MTQIVDIAIAATLIFAAFYFGAALLAHLHDSLIQCHRTAQNAIAPEPVASFEPVTVGFIGAVEEIKPVPPQKPVKKAPTAPAPLPNSIRGIRQYIRDNGLQAAIKEHLGKTVSRATKAELVEVLAAIA